MPFEPAYLFALLIGLLLGIMGSGGSILTVPVLRYLLHMSALDATVYSLFIVGTTSLFGAARSMYSRKIDIAAAIAFTPASVLGVFLVRRFILPAIPDEIHIASFSIAKGVLIMVLFAVLMVAAGFTMIRKDVSVQDSAASKKLWLEPLLGFVVGMITAFVGAGGGFLIIPSLVLFAKVPMRRAVGTSLLIITINCFVGFFSDTKVLTHIDWKLLIIFSALAVLGITLGIGLQKKIPGEKLKKSFGYFVLVMAGYIIFKELVMAH